VIATVTLAAGGRSASRPFRGRARRNGRCGATRGLFRRHLLAEQIAPVPIHHTDDDEAYYGLLNNPQDRQPSLPVGHKA